MPSDSHTPIPLNYQPLPDSSRRAKRIRLAMVTLAALAIVFGVIFLLNPLQDGQTSRIGPLGWGLYGTPAGPLNDSQNARAILFGQSMLYLALFLFMQWIFLCPRRSWRLRTTPDGPPPPRAAIAAGFIGMLLSMGLLAAILELLHHWSDWTLVQGPQFSASQSFKTVWIVMAALWLVWTLAFWAYIRSLDRYSALTRMLRALIAGTILELLVAAPAHAWVVHNNNDSTSDYCITGTYTGVVFGCTAALWLFGPGAFLLFLREKRRRERIG